MNKLKKLLANKNVVTILGAILIVVVLYGFYEWRVSNATNPVKIPYALVEIPARTKITEDMIGYVEVPNSAVKGDIITNVKTGLLNGDGSDKYTKVNAIIPAGSYFYSSMICKAEELADSYLNDLNGSGVYTFSVDVLSSYGNSLYPGNMIDVYFRVKENTGDIKIAKLMNNLEVLAVKDGSGKNVFETIEEERTPSQIIVKVSEEQKKLLMAAESVNNSELILNPTDVTLVTEDKTTITSRMTNQEIKEYILDRATIYEDDEEEVVETVDVE